MPCRSAPIPVPDNSWGIQEPDVLVQGAQICGIFAAVIGKGITAELGLRIEFLDDCTTFCLRGQHNRAVMAPRTSKAARKHRVSSVGCVAVQVDKGGERVKSVLRLPACLGRAFWVLGT